MKATEFFFDYQELLDVYADNKHTYERNNPQGNYEEDFYKITDKYLKSDPLAYLKFGPYWWAVKAAMNKKGFMGYYNVDEPYLMQTYSIRFPDENKIDRLTTLTAAWVFKDAYNALYFQGNRDFAIWDNGELWRLYDLEWESRF